MPREDYPQELYISGREKRHTANFHGEESLYRGFSQIDIDDAGQIKLESIRFPDFSCNWSRFSAPHHVRYRQNGDMTDGCYSFSVETARYKNLANVVHDPVDDIEYPNYAHVEVRRLMGGESVDFEPPKGRKWKNAKSLKLEYRQNLLNNHRIELPIDDS